ncbi:hypothetical protein ACH40F_08075 [Streptomyces sp. NPDC020794]|uniref:hypothetical protein n=1 Tax=unclassified Streptomyces TaxID=2593676 RepID=UPI0036E18362
MGWNSANRIFDPVAQALIKAGADDDTKRTVLRDLIKELQEGDWDTEDESLEDFLDDPAIVQAFADRNVHLSDKRCCRAEHANDPAALLLVMRHEDVDEDEMKRAVDAYGHHLAEQLRQDAALRETEGQRELALYGRELADLITPQPQPMPEHSRNW